MEGPSKVEYMSSFLLYFFSFTERDFTDVATTSWHHYSSAFQFQQPKKKIIMWRKWLLLGASIQRRTSDNGGKTSQEVVVKRLKTNVRYNKH